MFGLLCPGRHGSDTAIGQSDVTDHSFAIQIHCEAGSHRANIHLPPFGNFVPFALAVDAGLRRKPWNDYGLEDLAWLQGGFTVGDEELLDGDDAFSNLAGPAIFG